MRLYGCFEFDCLLCLWLADSRAQMGLGLCWWVCGFWVCLVVDLVVGLCWWVWCFEFAWWWVW